jgi:hypothetical protein
MMNSVAKRLVLRAHAVVSRSALSGTARAVLRDRLTYLSPMKLRRLETSLGDILKREVPGDVVEFGVALGGTAIILAEQAKRASRTFQGFDVFGMIPPPTSEKDDTHSKERYETIVSGQSKGSAATATTATGRTCTAMSAAPSPDTASRRTAGVSSCTRGCSKTSCRRRRSARWRSPISIATGSIRSPIACVRPPAASVRVASS